MTREDDLLRRLPAHDVAPDRAEHIRQRAHRVLRARTRTRRARPPRASRWSGYYRVYVEPAALITLGIWYLAWTVQDTVAIFQ